MRGRSFSDRLARESEAWVAEGVITADQAVALQRRYADEERTAARSRATVALATIGAVAVGLGVIAFFAANWDGLSHGLRLLLLTAAIAGSYAAAYQLRERTASLPRVGEALYLLGVLLFGASLFLVGQMYNVEAHDPFALLLWAVAATATALVVRSRAIAAVAVLVFTGWVGFEFGLALDNLDDAFGAFPVAVALYGAALYGAATAAHEHVRARWFAESGFAEAGRWLGLPLAAAGVFILTFIEAADELGTAGDELDGALLAAFLLLAAIALAGAAGLALGGRPGARPEAAVLVALVVTLIAAVLAGGSGDLYAVIFNVLFAVVALGVIYGGYLSDEPWLVNLGIVFVAVDLVARYFDVFWDALPRSVGLIGAGLVVLGIAYVLERQRKRLLRRMEA